MRTIVKKQLILNEHLSEIFVYDKVLTNLKNLIDMIKWMFSILFVALAFLSHAQKDYPMGIDIENSTIEWTGKKVLGQHNGTINLKDGNIVFRDGKIVKGKFTVDMTSIEVTDLKGGGAAKLKGHLESADFFSTEEFNEAKFVSTKITPEAGVGDYIVEGELTIKGITKPISFSVNSTDSEVKGRIVIDRTKYDIKYGSGSFFDNLGDKAIDDNFVLDIKAVFKS